MLLNDEAFRVARSAWNPPIHVVLLVASSREPAFPVLKVLSSVIPGKRSSVSSLKRIQKIIRFLRRRPLGLAPWRKDLSFVQRRWRGVGFRRSQFSSMRSSLGRTCERNRA